MNRIVIATLALAAAATLTARAQDIKQLATSFAFTEGPALGPDGKIYFSDIPNSRIHAHDPKSGDTKIHRENSGGANGLEWSADGSTLFACEGKARRISRQKGDAIEAVVDQFEGKKLNAPNDLALDKHGGLYFTDPAYGLKDADKEQSCEGVYYVAADGKTKRVIDTMKRPNGITISPDGKTLVVADHGGSAIWKYPVTAPGQLGEGKKIADIGSDGLVLDAKGNILCTWKTDVVVLGPDGAELRKIKIPEGPANVELVGEKLYITARKSFYVLDYKP